jgi:hypothetical protein
MIQRELEMQCSARLPEQAEKTRLHYFQITLSRSYLEYSNDAQRDSSRFASKYGVIYFDEITISAIIVNNVRDIKQLK